MSIRSSKYTSANLVENIDFRGVIFMPENSGKPGKRVKKEEFLRFFGTIQIAYFLEIEITNEFVILLYYKNT